jgi:Spx/MgsR family transcriptional regulator
MTTIYGISNCDTVKKALKWLDSNKIDYTFHDFRKDGLDEPLLSTFINKSDWQALLNKRSTTYRNLSDEIKNNLDQALAQKTLLANPTLIKRPVLIHNEQLTLGFKEQNYQQIFGIK